MMTKAQVESIPIIPQRQDALVDQLIDLMKVAHRLGMWDAADWIQARLTGWPNYPDRAEFIRETSP